MRLLLDTHVAIWSLLEPERISAEGRSRILDSGNVVHVSAASIWEIAVKFPLDRQTAPPFSATEACDYFRQAGFVLLDITPAHAAVVERLPLLHGDPFDRLLIAQALAEPMVLLTHDRQVAAYDTRSYSSEFGTSPMPSLKPLVAGNWKMNGLKASAAELGKIVAGYGPELRSKVELAICPPATLLSTFAVVALGSKLAVGAQDCHPKASGAHTGDISAEMIADTGATHVIVGHSERRTDHAESDALVRAKAEAAWRAGLVAILCIGETEVAAPRRHDPRDRRSSARRFGSRGANAGNLVIAYEPVWAIGTGLTPSNDGYRRSPRPYPQAPRGAVWCRRAAGCAFSMAAR